MSMNEIEGLAGDLPPVNETNEQAEEALETAETAVIIAQSTLSEVENLRKEQDDQWRNDVLNSLATLNEMIDRMQTTLDQMTLPVLPEIQPEESSEPPAGDLTIESQPEETQSRRPKKSRKRRVRW